MFFPYVSYKSCGSLDFLTAWPIFWKGPTPAFSQRRVRSSSLGWSPWKFRIMAAVVAVVAIVAVDLIEPSEPYADCN